MDGDRLSSRCELLEGVVARERLERVSASRRRDGRIVMQVARAMTRAMTRASFIRDLKPDNIFLVPNDDEEVREGARFRLAKAQSVGGNLERLDTHRHVARTRTTYAPQQ